MFWKQKRLFSDDRASSRNAVFWRHLALFACHHCFAKPLRPPSSQISHFWCACKKGVVFKMPTFGRKRVKMSSKTSPFVFCLSFLRRKEDRLSLPIPKQWWHATLSSFVCESKTRLPPRFLGENGGLKKRCWRFCTCKNTCLNVSKNDTFLCFALFFPKKM